MKFAAIALLVAGVASTSVLRHSIQESSSSVKEHCTLQDAAVAEVAAVLKLFARERPHQRFCQKQFEDALVTTQARHGADCVLLAFVQRVLYI